MDINSFFQFFTGIYVDYDGADGDQCFDLANAYSRWIGGQRFTGATADLIYNQPGDFYTQIPNTPDGIPQKGDIVIWNWPHVGIATGENSSTSQFEVLEQNDPSNSNCHIKVYLNYNGVIGWLRPKQLPESLQKTIDDLRVARDNNWNLYQGEIKTNGELKTQIIDLQNQLKECQNKTISITIPADSTTASTNPVVIPITPPPSISTPTVQVPIQGNNNTSSNIKPNRSFFQFLLSFFK